MSETTHRPLKRTTVQIHLSEGHMHSVTGWVLPSVPGLALTREWTAATESESRAAGYRLTHVPSGYGVPLRPVGRIETLRQGAKVLEEVGSLGIDWTQPQETMREALLNPDGPWKKYIHQLETEARKSYERYKTARTSEVKKSNRMTFEVTITPTQIKVTATPLVPDVTPAEMYEAECELAMKIWKPWQKAMEAMGAPLQFKSLTTIHDHEPKEDKAP